MYLSANIIMIMIIKTGGIMILGQCEFNKKYFVEKIECNEKEARYLLTLGCYAGSEILIISKVSNNYIVKILDSKYGINEKIVNKIKVKG